MNTTDSLNSLQQRAASRSQSIDETIDRLNATARTCGDALTQSVQITSTRIPQLADAAAESAAQSTAERLEQSTQSHLTSVSSAATELKTQAGQLLALAQQETTKQQALTQRQTRLRTLNLCLLAASLVLAMASTGWAYWKTSRASTPTATTQIAAQTERTLNPIDYEQWQNLARFTAEQPDGQPTMIFTEPGKGYIRPTALGKKTALGQLGEWVEISVPPTPTKTN